ncbi:MAG: hypothetical protein QW130_02510 [Sulfolobales archaeon]
MTFIPFKGFDTIFNINYHGSLAYDHRILVGLVDISVFEAYYLFKSDFLLALKSEAFGL